MRWALLLVLLSTSALASRADRLSVPPRLDRRDRLGAASAASPILLSLSLLPPDSECSGTPPDGVTFTRASAATCIDSSGVAHALTTDEARVHSTLGLLVEGSATNAVLHSRDVTAASWSGVGCSKTATGMDGVLLVGRCTGATSVSQTLTVATGARTASAYARRQSGTCTVALSADSENTSKALAGGWERLTLTYTSDGSVAVGIGVSSGCVADIDYVQDEAGSIATSPIVTAGTAAVRAAEAGSLAEPSVGYASTGCVALSLTPSGWGGASAPGSYLLSYSLTQATNRLLYVQANATEIRSYAGGSVASKSTTYVSGGSGRYFARWNSSANELRACDEQACGTAVAFGGFSGGGSSLALGNTGSGLFAAQGHLRNLVLGATPEACQ